MSYLKDFIIPFEGLSIGNHEFGFEVNRSFFEEITYSEISNGLVNVNLDFEKQETMFILSFSIEGNVEVMCDRCTDNFNYSIKGEQQLLVQFGDEFVEEDSEMIVIPRGDNVINLAPFIYEYIFLMLPIQKIHPDDQSGNSTCNSEMLKKLDELSYTKIQDDPRWDALKKLKKN